MHPVPRPTMALTSICKVWPAAYQLSLLFPPRFEGYHRTTRLSEFPFCNLGSLLDQCNMFTIWHLIEPIKNYPADQDVKLLPIDHMKIYDRS